MSAYSDWKCGAISYQEYRQEAAYEARVDKAWSDDEEEDEDEDRIEALPVLRRGG